MRPILRIKLLDSPSTESLLLILVDELADRWQYFPFGIFLNVPLNSLLDLDVVRLVKTHRLLRKLLNFLTYC